MRLKNVTKFFLLGALPLALLCGCGKGEKQHVVNKIRVLQGAEQCALPGQAFNKKIRLELLGKNVPGLLGGKGERPPASGVKVALTPIDGSDLKISCREAVSDAGGGISFSVTAGKKVGDQYLKVVPVKFPDKSVTIRLITGIAVSGLNQEGSAGSYLPKPITVTVVTPEGKPARAVPVYFKLVSSPSGAKTKAVMENSTVITNAQGVAETNLKLGKKTGTFNVEIEVADPQNNYHIRGIIVREMGIDPLGVIATVLGGLALFIFGMKQMSDGLQKVAGAKMKKILQFFAGNRFIAVVAGTLITAVIQSSSATTVMVIGFVNAGLLNLVQAIGIVFGANIGTTVTAQIISFKLTGLALPAITIGLAIMFSRNRLVKGWGEGILGFGLLFFGMSIMSTELKVLGHFPSFISFFKTFDCTPTGGYMPLGAILGAIGIGALMTMVVQSSSASTGIILALAGGGLVNFYTAVPLVLGTNIGTTITAILASIAANRHAKQAALAHCLFNISGALVMIGLFYIPWGNTGIPVFLYFINTTAQGDVFATIPQNIVRHIAMAHTFFNVFNVLLLLPFIGVIARICMFFIPIKDKDDEKIQPLEPHLLDTPSIALEQAVQALRGMVKRAWKMVDQAIDKHFLPLNIDNDKFDDLAAREAQVDEMQSEITEYLVRITRRELTDSQSELVPLLMHCTNDAERIADHTENIITLTRRLAKSKEKLSESGKKELSHLWEVAANQAKNVITALDGTNTKKVTSALKDEKKINRLADEYEKSHINRLRKGKCDATVGVIFIEMLGEIEKIGDHLSNIAERAPEMQKHYIDLN